jgi:hypothetical protein
MKAIYETGYGWPIEVKILGYTKGPSVWAEKMIVVRAVYRTRVIMPEVNYEEGEILEVDPLRLWKKVKPIGRYCQRWEYIGRPDLSGLAEYGDH